MATDIRLNESAPLTAIKLANGNTRVIAGCQAYDLTPADVAVLAKATQPAPEPTFGVTYDEDDIPTKLPHIAQVAPNRVEVMVAGLTPTALAQTFPGIPPSTRKEALAIIAKGNLVRLMFNKKEGTWGARCASAKFYGLSANSTTAVY